MAWMFDVFNGTCAGTVTGRPYVDIVSGTGDNWLKGTTDDTVVNGWF